MFSEDFYFTVEWDCLDHGVKKSPFFQVGPEKGVVHLATAAIINALWDLWAKMEGKVCDGFIQRDPESRQLILSENGLVPICEIYSVKNGA